MASTPPVATLPFADARGCRDWLGTLPLTNLAQAQATLLGALQGLGAASLDRLESLKCLEILRERVGFMQDEQRARYFGKTLPLAAQDERVWQAGQALLAALEAGYARAFEDASTGSGDIARHAALAAQRVMRAIGAQMQLHMGIYRRFDPQLWTRLHALYRRVEAAGLAAERVKDSLEADEGGSSPMEAYARVVLMQAAYLSELTAPQIDFTGALLRQWTAKVALRRAPAEDTLPPALHPLVVDFDKPIGARPLPPAEVRSHHRIVDVSGLSQSIRRRLHGLRNGEDIASLRLPAQAAAIEVGPQLERLHRLWCEGAPPRPPARVPEERAASLVFGAGELHFFLSGGKPFEAPGQSRELTRQEKEDIEVFGQVSQRTQNNLRATQHAVVTAERWGVIDEMLGAWRLRRPEGATHGLAIGRLVGMRLADAAPFFLGMVTALSQETDGSIVATVALFPGKPECVPVRPDSRGRAAGKWQEGFRLPAMAKLGVPASLVVPLGTCGARRALEVWDGEAGRFVETASTLERGSDFERVALSG